MRVLAIAGAAGSRFTGAALGCGRGTIGVVRLSGGVPVCGAVCCAIAAGGDADASACTAVFCTACGGGVVAGGAGGFIASTEEVPLSGSAGGGGVWAAADVWCIACCKRLSARLVYSC